MRSFILILVLLFPGLCNADTIHVPADQPAIQAGIDVAVNGDTVLVAPGTYVENIDFLQKTITVKSSSGAKATIIDGGNASNRVVMIYGDLSSDCVLDGFTITNSTGGGIYVSSSPTIINNIISNNSVSRGGGIYGYRCYGSISNNLIIENSAENGGGIYCTELFDSDSIGGGKEGSNGRRSHRGPAITNNIITGNTATTGGAIECQYGGTHVFNNTITGNSADRGGGIYSFDDSMNIVKNLIADNTATYTGGGLYFINYADSFIAECTIVNNTAGSSGGGCYSHRSGSTFVNNIFAWNTADSKGGAVHLDLSGEYTFRNNTITGNLAGETCGAFYCMGPWLTIENTILWDNVSPSGLNIWIGRGMITGELSISYSDLQGGQPTIHVEPDCTLNWGAGMIDAFPHFVDPINKDFHLTYNSPCRDTGDNSVVEELFDFEGDPRIAHGTVDMGADEFSKHFYCTGDFTPGGSIKGKLVDLPGTSPTGIFFGSGLLDPPLPSKWGDFHLEAPWLIIPLGLAIDADGVLVLEEDIPLTPAAPYDVFMQAIIGLDADSLTNPFVMEIR